MPRTKGGVVTRKRRKKILKLAKGYYGSKHTLYRTANQQVMKSLVYAYRDRRRRKRDFRRLWIARINAGARLNGLSYNQLMHGLKKAKIEINRKMLADIAVNDAAAFSSICDKAKKQLAK
jgi:large subunit ribosomal protein L20